MLEYKLESHLNELCTEYPRYISLNSTWTLNKRACSDLLKSVLMHYPHYSLHDASHSEAVLSKMEMLLGDRIKRLSPTDTWLLLHAAYVHDLGMVIQWDEIEKLWEEEEFKKYLEELKSSPDSEIREAADFILNAKTKDRVWPLKASRYVSLINADYFRSKHAQRSRSLLFSDESELHVDLGHNQLVQQRLVKLLGEICALHTASTEKILELDYQTNGFDSDYAHPRFVAMLLRLGDLLDIDNNRFNRGVELSFGHLPPTSIPHKEKHNATAHLLVTPTEISFRSNCPNSESYLEAQRFVSWLESEISFLTIHWAKIVPKDLGGYAPCFEKKELQINGVESIPGVAGLKFQISQNKAFEVIEGSNLYKNRFVFIREVIQNAMDASKIQLWRDLQEGTYKAWVKSELNQLQPYDLINEIYSNYPITVELSTLDDERVQVKVMDRGTGISVEAFKEMCNVAVSNSNSQKMQKEIQSMPKWLQPTAGFGIGLQSIFLVADQFEIETNTGTESLHAVFHSQRTGGHVQLQLSDKKFERGTLITVQFKKPESIRYSATGVTNRYLETELDLLSGMSHMGEVRIVEEIHAHCQNSQFPIMISCDESMLETHTIENKVQEIKTDEAKWEGRYQYTVDSNKAKVTIWDTRDFTYAEIWFMANGYGHSQILFKGIEVSENKPGFDADSIYFYMDLYGLNTKESITLDRNSFTSKGRQIVADQIKELKDVFVEIMLKAIQKENSEGSQDDGLWFDLYVFWKVCDDEQRKRIPEKALQKLCNKITVLSKESDAFKETHIKVSEIITDLEKFVYVIPKEFDGNPWRHDRDYKEICDILNKDLKNSDEENIIADRDIENSIRHYWIKKLRIVGKEKQVVLYKLSRQEVDAIDVEDDNEKREILKGLGNDLSDMRHGGFSFVGKQAKRYAIPAISDYKHLAVKSVPYGVRVSYNFTCHFIISPFVREENENRKKMGKEQFVSSIIRSEHFKNLLKYVKDNSCYENNSIEQIREEYITLLHDYYEAMNNTVAGMSEPGTSEKK